MTDKFRDADKPTHDAITSEDDLVQETRTSFYSRYGEHAPLGKGGMGEVYLVRDQRIGRDVALKVNHPQRGRIEEDRRRFVREARVQGLLEHPSIVPVHDLGLSPEGQPYFVMFNTILRHGLSPIELRKSVFAVGERAARVHRQIRE